MLPGEAFSRDTRWIILVLGVLKQGWVAISTACTISPITDGNKTHYELQTIPGGGEPTVTSPVTSVVYCGTRTAGCSSASARTAPEKVEASARKRAEGTVKALVGKGVGEAECRLIRGYSTTATPDRPGRPAAGRADSSLERVFSIFVSDAPDTGACDVEVFSMKRCTPMRPGLSQSEQPHPTRRQLNALPGRDDATAPPASGKKPRSSRP